jgi:hypothetical protein
VNLFGSGSIFETVVRSVTSYVSGVLYIGTGIQSDGVGTGSVVGNARGSGANDLQTSRAAASQVASGATSVICGGGSNTASGASSFVGSGSNNTASNERAFVGSGQDNIASGARAFVGSGTSNTASGSYASIPAGIGNAASGQSALAVGEYASATRYAETAHAGGRFAATGDAQHGWMVLRGSTTNGNPTELTTPQRFVLVDDSTYACNIMICARRTDADGESAAYRRFAVIDRNAGTTALVGAVASTDTIEDQAAWDVSITANDTTDALTITVTGEAGKTIYWVASVHYVKVTG